nr:hypothetical protein [Tanacetum cinerariifolium]
MLENHQLTGPNFNEWFRALKLVVRTEKLHDAFETALPPASVAGADAQALADWAVLFDRHNEVACLMLGTMHTLAALSGLTAVIDTGLDRVCTAAGTICFWGFL